MDGRTAFGTFLREIADGGNASKSVARPTVHAQKAWRRLRKEVAPFSDESLRGLVARSCAHNHLPNSFGLLQHIGLKHRNLVAIAEDQEIELAQLAYAVGVEEREIRFRCYDPIGEQKISFFGLTVARSAVESRVRRFSPVGLAISPHHRALWELRDVPFCFEGWDLLQDLCGCEGEGIVQRWTRTQTKIHECDRCGDSLAELVTFDVPPQMRDALSLLEPLVHPLAGRREATADRLPDRIREADRSAVFRLIIRVARAIDPFASERPIEEPSARLHALHAACCAAGRWPLGLDEIEWHSSTSRDTIAALRRDFLGLAGCASPAGSTVALEAFSRPVGIRRAGEIAKLSPEVLQAAWENKLVTQHRRSHGSRTLPAFDPNEIAHFGSAWNTRLSSSAVARRLGTSVHGLEQLVLLDLINARAPSLPGTGLFFQPEAVEQFLAEFEERSLATVADPVPLRDLLRALGGRAKAWGPIFQHLKSKALPFALGDGDQLTQRIHVSKQKLAMLEACVFDRASFPSFTFATEMTQRDACDLLNIVAGSSRVLGRLSATGTNPIMYAVDEVERLAARIVTLGEISARTGEDPATIYHRLVAEGHSPVTPGGWDRYACLGEPVSDLATTSALEN